MATPEQYAWQQQSNESIMAYQAFVIYRNLEPNERSLQRVGSELVKSVTLISRWSAKHDWMERVALWDDFQELKRLEKRIEQKQKMDEQHLQWINLAKGKAAKALAKVDEDALARNFNQLMLWMVELIRMERLIRGEPESIEERRERLEVKSTTHEELRVYVPVFQELIDEGAITLDAGSIPKGFDCREGGVEGDDEDDEPIEFKE